MTETVHIAPGLTLREIAPGEWQIQLTYRDSSDGAVRSQNGPTLLGPKLNRRQRRELAKLYAKRIGR